MTQEEILNKVIAFADHAHGEQIRKYSAKRYIVHPIEVMKICSHYTNETEVLCAALLHDVLEDTTTSKEEIIDFLGKILEMQMVNKVIKLTTELTDVYTKEAFPLFNRRVRKEKEHKRLSTISAEAQTIKYADLISNSIDFEKKDKDFGIKFLLEAQSLLLQMNKGDDALYTLAIETIKDCLVKANRQLSY